MHGTPEQRAIDEEPLIGEQRRLADDHGNHGDVHRIADVAVGAGDDEVFGGRHGAGVPSPRSAKRAKESTSCGTPIVISIYAGGARDG
jgi:hypothetical protein